MRVSAANISSLWNARSIQCRIRLIHLPRSRESFYFRPGGGRGEVPRAEWREGIPSRRHCEFKSLEQSILFRTVVSVLREKKRIEDTLSDYNKSLSHRNLRRDENNNLRTNIRRERLRIPSRRNLRGAPTVSFESAFKSFRRFNGCTVAWRTPRIRVDPSSVYFENAIVLDGILSIFRIRVITNL